jgi:peroxiredoxin
MSLAEVDWSRIPPPTDDGEADHLPGRRLPDVALPATDGRMVNLSRLAGRTIAYIYPMTGRPDTPLPEGWDMIPGARGCTPQSCAFRDHFEKLRALGIDALFGLSVHDTAWQSEAAERLHLPFALLSDAGLAFADALRLPRMDVQGMILLKRLTLVIDAGRITRAFYPVFPPDAHVGEVVSWLENPPR